MGPIRLNRRKWLALTAGVALQTAVSACGLRPAFPAPSSSPPAPISLTPTAAPPTDTPFASTNAQPSPTAEIPATATPTPARKELVWWIPWIGDQWTAVADALIARFTSTHPLFDVRPSFRNADFGRMYAQFASGTIPDVFCPEPLVAFAGRNLIRPLDDLLDHGGVNRTNFFDQQLVQVTWKNVTWAIPALDNGPELGLVWNRSLVRQQIVWDASRPPVAWSELLAFGKTLTIMDKDKQIQQLGFDPVAGAIARIDTARDVTGIDWYDSRTGAVTLTHPEYLAFANDVYHYFDTVDSHDVKLFREQYPWDPSSHLSGIQQGREMAILGRYWTPWEIQRLAANAQWDFAFDWLPTDHPNQHLQRIGGRALGLPSGAPNGSDGWTFIEMLVSDEANTILRQTTGRFGLTRSFLDTTREDQDPGFGFYRDSVTTGDRLTGHSMTSVSGFAEAVWAQALMSMIIDDTPASQALRGAELAISAQVARVGVG